VQHDHVDSGTPWRRLTLGVLALMAWLGQAAPCSAEVHVAVWPAQVMVEPGEVFEVAITITEGGSAFNGYDAVIGYDPDVLTFLPRPAAQQEGPLMVGACPNRFHVFDSDPDAGTCSVAHVLLCAGISVTGPGVVYRLQFQAGATAAATAIAFLPGTGFYLAGMYVTPLLTADAIVQVGAAVAAPPGPLPARMDVAPNPFNPRTSIRFDLPHAVDVTLTVHDLQGRTVRVLASGHHLAGLHQVAWDGLNNAGRAAPSGTYLVRLATAAGTIQAVKATLAR
jgi:hypothetical protein